MLMVCDVRNGPHRRSPRADIIHCASQQRLGRAGEMVRCAASRSALEKKGTAMRSDSRNIGRHSSPASSLSVGLVRCAYSLAFAAMALLAQPAGAEQTDYANFDHLTTGF